MSGELTTQENIKNEVVAGFSCASSFEFMQRQAQMLASSELVPAIFSVVGIKDPQEKAKKIANTIIALEMANRIGASPMAVLQNIYIVHGKPSWSSTFVIASINGCGRFNSMKFEMSGEGESRTCIAVATEKATGERLESPPISIEMAKAEGWYGKSGSKWKTMPELMLRYRAATLFGRLYAPEILMGMRSVEEVADIEEATITSVTPTASSIMERFKNTETAEIPMTKEEIAEVSTDVKTVTVNPLLQTVYAGFAKLAEIRGETADDICDTLTKGKIGTQSELEGKPDNYLKDLMLVIDNEIAKEA